MIKLVENFSISKDVLTELPLTESVLTEKETGKVHETKKKYRVDVSRYDFVNLNGRDYPKELWERVIKDQKSIWEGSFALADHPVEEGSFKDIVGVWSNMHLDEGRKTVRADITFVGNYGKMATEILEAGGKIGFSSSGFGDLKEDGKTVDPTSYQIERIADCVLNPSQQVFGTIQDAIEENTSKPDPTDNKESVLKENNKMSGRKYSKLEERAFRTDIESFLNEALQVSEPNSRLTSLEEVLSYFEEGSPADLKEKVLAEVAKCKTEILESAKVLNTFKETFGTTNPEEFKEGFVKLATNSSLYERQADDWKKLAESLQEKIMELQSTIDSLPTQEQLEEAVALTKKAKTFYSNKISSMREDLFLKEESIEKNSAIIEQMIKELSNLKKENKELSFEKRDLSEKVDFLKSKAFSLEENIVSLKNQLAKTIREYEAPPKFKVQKSGKEMFEGFSESKEVTSYYNDLVKQHGDKILPYKERILGCKTLFEAMRIYTSALSEMTKDIRVVKTGNLSEDKKIVENATGYKIRKPNQLRKPRTWD